MTFLIWVASIWAVLSLVVLLELHVTGKASRRYETEPARRDSR
jgi:hypothetical protein